MRARGHFPTDEAALKLLYLVLNRSEKAWKMGPREWVMVKAQFAFIFGERFTRAMAARCSTRRHYTKFLTVPISRTVRLQPTYQPVLPSNRQTPVQGSSFLMSGPFANPTSANHSTHIG